MTTDLQCPTMNPDEIHEAMVNCFRAGLVPMLTGAPGIGKSSIVQAIADELNLELIDIRMSMCAPEDLMGLPMRLSNGKATFAPFDMFPLAEHGTKGEVGYLAASKLPAGKDGWLIFLDEFNSAPKSVQVAAYKLVLDRMVGQHRLHHRVVTACAGNRAIDKAVVNQMSTAMQSRLIHMEMEVSAESFIKLATTKLGFDHRILGFLNFDKKLFHNFDPNHQDKTFACPRTWDFVNQLIDGVQTEDISMPLVAGTVGVAAGTQFMSFIAEYGNLPDLPSILSNPDRAPLPSKSSTQYALASMLAQNMDRKNMQPLLQYATRLPEEVRVVFARQAYARDQSFMLDQPFIDFQVPIVEFMY